MPSPGEQNSGFDATGTETTILTSYQWRLTALEAENDKLQQGQRKSQS